MANIGSRTPQLRAVVHIGPIKTGSTAFTAQMSASQDRGELGETIVYALPREILRNNEPKIIPPEHIRYLAPKLEWSRQSGESESAGIGSNEIFGERARAYLDDLTTDLRARTQSDTTVFLVEETLSRRPGPGNLTTELLARFDSVDYVVVARAQQFTVPSAISQRVKTHSFPRLWDARLQTFLSNGNFTKQFDYADILDRWRSTDPRVRVVVVPFLESDRGTQNLFHRILNGVGVSTSLGDSVRGQINATPSRFEIMAIGAYKHVTYGISRTGLPPGSRRRKAFDGAQRLFQKVATIIRSPRWALSAPDLSRVVDHYRASNERFITSLGATGRAVEWTQWLDDAEVKPG
jgi:hypothetical protein